MINVLGLALGMATTLLILDMWCRNELMTGSQE